MKQIDLIVYDFDGTLVDTKRDIADSVNLVLRELGLPEKPHDTIFKFVGRGVDKLMSQALNGTGKGDIPGAVALFRKHYDLRLLDHSDFFPHGRETLEFFSRKKQAILSNKPRQFILRILSGLNCDCAFESILGGDSLENKKPDPEGLLLLMRQCGVSPERVLMVGDSPIDVETGKRAGVATCAATHGMSSRADLESAQPDWTISSLEELRHLFE